MKVDRLASKLLHGLNYIFIPLWLLTLRVFTFKEIGYSKLIFMLHTGFDMFFFLGNFITIIAATLILLGLTTRFTSTLLLISTVINFLSGYIADHNIPLAITYLILLCYGSGRFSLDYLLEKKYEPTLSSLKYRELYHKIVTFCETILRPTLLLCMRIMVAYVLWQFDHKLALVGAILVAIGLATRLVMIPTLIWGGMLFSVSASPHFMWLIIPITLLFLGGGELSVQSLLHKKFSKDAHT